MINIKRALIAAALITLLAAWTHGGSAVVPSTITIDGTGHATTPGASSLGVALTTVNADDLIVLFVGANAHPVLSVSGGGLTWFRRVQLDNEEYWYAVAPTALTAITITVTQSGSDFMVLDAFGVSGADTTSPFDGSPVTSITFPTAPPLFISTNNANDIIIGSARTNLTTNGAGAGFTAISSADFMTTEYKIVSSPQVNLPVNFSNDVQVNKIIADAIKAFPGGGTNFQQFVVIF